MLVNPLPLENLPAKIMGLSCGDLFIVGLNIILNLSFFKDSCIINFSYPLNYPHLFSSAVNNESKNFLKYI